MSDPLDDEINLKPEARDIIAAYAAIRTFEGDFDKAQGQFRAIASAWLIAVVGALALVTKSEFDASPMRYDAAALLRTLLLVAASAGFTVLWYVDQGVYQRLLHSAFEEGLMMERKYKFLPRIRMKLYDGNLNITAKLGMFYKVPLRAMLITNILNAAFLLVALQSVETSSVLPERFVAARTVLTLVIVVGHVVWWRWQLIKAADWAPLKVSVVSAETARLP